MAARRDGNRCRWGARASLSANLAAARQRARGNLIVRGPREMPPARHAAIVEHARIESEIAERKFTEQSLKFRAELNRLNTDLQDVAGAIPPDSALVSFVRYDRSFRVPQTRGCASVASERPPARPPASLVYGPRAAPRCPTGSNPARKCRHNRRTRQRVEASDCSHRRCGHDLRRGCDIIAHPGHLAQKAGVGSIWQSTCAALFRCSSCPTARSVS